MSLAARAEYLPDLSDLAARCAVCFTAARCAGADVKAIAPCASAAIALGADWKWLHSDGPAYESDAQYLAECESARIAVRRRGREVEDLMDEAVRVSEMAAAAMRAALMARPPDYAAYALAEATYNDAVRAWDICYETRERLIRADKALALAPYRYGDVYEQPVTFVARGGLLPYDGRWIEGQPQRPTVRWIGPGRPDRNAGNLTAGA